MTSSLLIGATGFVGGNLAAQHEFTATANSRTIADAYGKAFDLVVCAAPQAQKWWANQNPAEDLAGIERLVASLRQIQARRFLLLSTIDVFPRVAPFDGHSVDETLDCTAFDNHPYGRHRLMLEETVRGLYGETCILRLPALFGPGLKKNALFDLINDNNLHLIHPDSRYQWYDLSRLWGDIGAALAAGIGLAVLATEPIRTGAIRDRFFPGKAMGEKASASPALYDVRTIHAGIFGGADGYIESARSMLERIGAFVAHEPRSLP